MQAQIKLVSMLFCNKNVDQSKTFSFVSIMYVLVLSIEFFYV